MSGEGCFFVQLRNASSGKIGTRVSLSLSIPQHIREEVLIKSLVYYFKCGGYSKTKNHGVFTVSNLRDILEIIIPLFREHPIRGVKGDDFLD